MVGAALLRFTTRRVTVSPKRQRCAIYTRKSTEEGLDQAFNSLDAQREACEAFILSQKHEGWSLRRDRYDDGGVSGGTMQRPALGRLLEEVRAGRIDVIVVYKVDRLTRALSDFAKMVEIFDENDVSFVSVTQQFNTTTSMGRLTLNVLLSFAQFEREVTAERIRDKIAASKKKGMWMGGVVPLGYDAIDKRLVVKSSEAAMVRALFELYLEHGNVRSVQVEADRRGFRTKGRRPNGGSRLGGATLSRGHIYKLLANPLYIGEVAHKGARYPGEHEAIIDREIWGRVQRQLSANAVVRRTASNAKVPSLLAGLLVDDHGKRLLASHASKAGRRYRYYVSSPPSRGEDARDAMRIPADEIEGVVVCAIGSFLRDGRRVVEQLECWRVSAAGVKARIDGAADLGNQLTGASPCETRTIVLKLIDRVKVARSSVRIHFRAGVLEPVGARGKGPEAIPPRDSDPSSGIVLEIEVALGRRGSKMRLVLADDDQLSTAPDPKLVESVAQAHCWFEELRDGKLRSVRELAKREGMDRSDVGRTIRLAFLAPDIVEAIVAGQQPADLTMTRLKRIGHLPLSWSEQRKLLGFTE